MISTPSLWKGSRCSRRWSMLSNSGSDPMVGKLAKLETWVPFGGSIIEARTGHVFVFAVRAGYRNSSHLWIGVQG
jgi:hypothetical protein